MVEREWQLARGPNVDCSPPLENDRNWLDRCEHTPNKVVFSDCGQTMACMASSNNITLHSTVLDKEKGYYFKPATHTIKFVQPVTCIAFGVSHYVTSYGIRRPDNIPIIASGHANGNIGIWHGVTSQLITRLLSHTGWVNQIEISPPANYHTQILSASQDRTVKVWDFEDNGYNMSQTVTVPCPVYCLAWSPNGKLVAFGGSSQKIYVHHKELGKLIKSPAVKQLSGHLHNIISLKFFPDNAILVSASWDGRIQMWDPYTGEVRQIISMHFPLPNYVFPSQVMGMDISKYGHFIVNLSDKGKLYLWNPLSMQLRMSEPDCVLNVTPEDEIVIGEDGTNCSIKLACEEKKLLIPNFCSAKCQTASIRAPAPSLMHLCRLVIRGRISETPKLHQLKLPSRLERYLTYQTW